MDHFLIINPASAGGKTAARLTEIEAAAQGLSGKVTISQTQSPGHATELTREALRSGKTDSILVAGGDGTINEVVNGFFQQGQPVSDQPPKLGVIPSGSGSDFVRSFTGSNTVAEAFAEIENNQPTRLDLGMLKPLDGEPKVFANICSTGLSAEIGVNANKSKLLKKINGALAFNWNIVTTTLRHKRFPLLVRTEACPDGRLWEANCIAVCNGQYFGSGVRVAREADLSDGKLQMVIVHDHSPIGFLKGVNQIKADDKNLPEGISKEKSAWIEITCNHPNREVLIEADGEFAGRLPARFEVLPGAFLKY